MHLENDSGAGRYPGTRTATERLASHSGLNVTRTAPAVFQSHRRRIIMSHRSSLVYLPALRINLRARVAQSAGVYLNSAGTARVLNIQRAYRVTQNQPV